MSRKLILASTMTLVLAGTDVFALGLGGLRTQSVLNQPFAGEIDLLDIQTSELDAVKAMIAPPDAFSKAGVERYYYLTKLKFEPGLSAQGKPVIRVSSREPIREPYMDVLVEVVWASGQLIKEYTVLLDPPVLANRPGRRANAPLPAGSPPSGASSPVTSASNYLSAPGDGFPLYIGPIASGSGLWSLAREYAPADATAAQTVMALYRNNQHAFIRGNINRLIAGKTLVIPTRAELFALDAAAAKREYATALRGGAVRRAPITQIPDDALSSRLAIAGAARETAAPSSSAATPPVQGSSTSPAKPADPAMEQDLLLALETSESARQETVELRDRIQELETQLADIQTLLQLRNDELARIQNGGAAPGVLGGSATDAPSSVPASLTSEPETDPRAFDGQGTDMLAPPQADDTVPIQSEASPASDTTEMLPTPDVLEPSDTPLALMPVPVPNAVSEEVAPQSEEAIGEPEKAAPAPTAEAESRAPESSSTWDSLLLPLAGFAGITALGLVIFSLVTAKRRRREEEKTLDLDEVDFALSPEDDNEPAETPPQAGRGSGEDTPALDADAKQPATSGKDEDSESNTPLSMMSSLSNFDAETDEADVLSEADVYLAYGRYSEALDLLRTEMDRYPERMDIKYKLADAYIGSRDAQSLRDMMRMIEESGGDRADPAQWKRLRDLSDKMLSDESGQTGAMGSGARPPAAERSEADQMSSDILEDSKSLGLDDAFSLDISDIQQASEDFLDEQPADDEKSSAAVADDGLEPDSSLKISDDILDGILDEASTEPASSSDPSPLEQDSFGEALTVPTDTGRNSRDSDPFADLARASAEIDSELVLTLEEPRVETDGDLDSMFDSTLADEPTLVRNEMAGARPSDSEPLQLPPLDREGLAEADPAPEQESAPTDLLSSQWQMDSGIWDETATKLDLARAYIEMDDADAAREILQEVSAEGGDEQREEARALLDKLA